VGFDIDATIAGWQSDLDRLESELRRPNLRHAELNGLRDELQRVRSGVEVFWDALRPRLEAAKAEVGLREPAPAAGQPQEPEQVALKRAELNCRLGLLSAGQDAVNAAQFASTNSSTRSRNDHGEAGHTYCGLRSLLTNWRRLRPPDVD
jgi:potassium-dependent mechanosensitive channel